MASIFRRRSTSAANYISLDPLSQGELERHRSIAFTPLNLILLVTSFIFVSIISFIAGKHVSTSCTHQEPGDKLIQLHPSPHIFTYNEIFAARPNLTTNKAWLDLFPFQGGFFGHPDLPAGKRGVFAVWHQLHCLDNLRHTYWTLLDKTNPHDSNQQGHARDKTDLPHHVSPIHTQHCIDLLRNAFMCQPDLTVEIVEEKVSGVRGFGTEHNCVNWRELVEWTGRWEGYGQGNRKEG
ncbi:hypothetical protein B0J11DRAFT_520105 [Dendryphion nanum]|uniref:Oxidase ustYa n=1 Tax=Dendryphion nanum TaxID=256645 RepID=A0A9P9IQV0_9PLEO|nr:hypothetical protein B0J11DRAFT_520105 [Dendryphion nanum]